MWQVNEGHVNEQCRWVAVCQEEDEEEWDDPSTVPKDETGTGRNICWRQHKKISTGVACRCNIVQYELITSTTIFLLFFECHTYIKVQKSSTLLFLVVFFGGENSWNFATAYHPPTMVPPPAGALDGTPSYRDRLPTVGRLVWKAQALYKEVMGFFLLAGEAAFKSGLTYTTVSITDISGTNRCRFWCITLEVDM